MFDIEHSISELNAKIADFEKTIATSDTAFPIRENLAAEAKILVPVDTPLLNRLPTKPGAGKAAAWKEITSFGSPVDAANAFYAEGGTPSGRTTTYADRSETYKLIGLDGGVTGFAVAAGATFQDQLAAEKSNTILHLKRLEEQAIINAPGTGNTFSGLLTQITTGNGSYVAASNGASAILTDMDAFLKDRWDAGAQPDLFVMRSAEAKAFSNQVTSDSSSPLRVVKESESGLTGGFFVNAYISPVDGQLVEVVPDRFLTTGTIIGIVGKLPVPVQGQGGEGIYLDTLLDYALSDVPTTSDTFSFRVKRYYTLCIPALRFCGKLTGF